VRLPSGGLAAKSKGLYLKNVAAQRKMFKVNMQIRDTEVDKFDLVRIGDEDVRRVEIPLHSTLYLGALQETPHGRPGEAAEKQARRDEAMKIAAATLGDDDAIGEGLERVKQWKDLRMPEDYQ
jgi:hypothetical protein